MTIGEIIRYKRKRLGLTQKQLADKAGFSKTSICYWECGIYYPSVMDLCDLADFFGCTTDELLGRTEIGG
jgi:transcriptional regulator with XRE-family HTH domain